MADDTRTGAGEYSICYVLVDFVSPSRVEERHMGAVDGRKIIPSGRCHN